MDDLQLVTITHIGEFERAIIKIGIVAACEWFGHAPDSEFTKETIVVLQERYTHLINKEEASNVHN